MGATFILLNLVHLVFAYWPIYGNYVVLSHPYKMILRRSEYAMNSAEIYINIFIANEEQHTNLCVVFPLEESRAKIMYVSMDKWTSFFRILIMPKAN